MIRRDVSVVVCTHRRPGLLASCLESLARQLGPRVLEVLVVDNDPRASAAAVVEAWRGEFVRAGVDVRYGVEPRLGIASARNRTVALARGEILAFIDDDERAAGGWLDAHLAALTDPAVDGAIGPVEARFPDGFPAWLAGSALFRRPRHPNGVPLRASQCSMGNAVLRRARLLGREGPFRPSVTRMGEDTDLFRWLIGRGCKIVWQPRAIVEELQEPARGDWRWHVRRGFWSGRSWTAQLLQDRPGLCGVARVLASLGSGTARLLARSLAQADNPRAALVYLARGLSNQAGKLVQLAR